MSEKYVDEILRICEEFDAGEFCGETWRDKVQQQIRKAQLDVLDNDFRKWIYERELITKSEKMVVIDTLDRFLLESQMTNQLKEEQTNDDK